MAGAIALIVMFVLIAAGLGIVLWWCGRLLIAIVSHFAISLSRKWFQWPAVPPQGERYTDEELAALPLDEVRRIFEEKLAAGCFWAESPGMFFEDYGLLAPGIAAFLNQYLVVSNGIEDAGSKNFAPAEHCGGVWFVIGLSDDDEILIRPGDESVYVSFQCDDSKNILKNSEKFASIYHLMLGNEEKAMSQH